MKNTLFGIMVFILRGINIAVLALPLAVFQKLTMEEVLPLSVLVVFIEPLVKNQGTLNYLTVLQFITINAF